MDSRRSSSSSDLDDLPSRIAHAIGTPLSALIGTAQMCAEDSAGEDPRLDRVLRLSRRVAAIVRAMLDLSRSRLLEWSKASARTLLDEIAAELDDRCDKASVQLSTRVYGDVPTFDADRTLLAMALVSIAENAVDQMEATGGELRLDAQHRPAAESGDEGVIVFRISDTGPGLPDEVRETLFEPFVTTNKKGVGLGLSIARTVIEAHLGTIRADDNPGGGALFVVEIPQTRTVEA